MDPTTIPKEFLGPSSPVLGGHLHPCYRYVRVSTWNPCTTADTVTSGLVVFKKSWSPWQFPSVKRSTSVIALRRCGSYHNPQRVSVDSISVLNVICDEECWWWRRLWGSCCWLTMTSTCTEKKKLNSCFLKHIRGGLISDRFSRWLEFPEKCAKHYAEHLLFRWIELKIYSAVIWHLFWGKNFLTLRHL